MADRDISLDYTMPFQLTNRIRREPFDLILPENPENSQKGKIVIVTGGGTGICAAAAAVWVRAGAEGVVIAGRRLGPLEETATNLKALNKEANILTVRTDLTVDDDVKNLFTQVVAIFGRPADVVLANAGTNREALRSGEERVDDWWSVWETNLKALYATAHWFIATQPNINEPVGTLISINSGLAGMITPGLSAYCVSKLASQRFIEFLDAEYPTLRSFTMFPGVVETPMLQEAYRPYANDDAELVGMTALWLVKPDSDFLRGGLTSVDWDIEEMVANKEQIVEKQLLKLAWVPILRASGGKGLEVLS